MTMRTKHQILLASLLTFCSCMGLALFTDHRWEDWYITFRASKNLALGNGLVFNEGEKIMTYTSPLGTLIPAFLKYLFVNMNDDVSLWGYRLVSSLLLSFVPFFIFRILEKSEKSLITIIIVQGLLIFNFIVIDMSINGMEGAFMVFFMAYLVFILVCIPPNTLLHFSVCFAGLMLSRPDGFIYGGSVIFGFFAFQKNPLGKSKADAIFFLIKSILFSLLIYSPWFIWTWIYYGTPIPHTISAKGASGSLFEYLVRVKDYIFRYRGLRDIFLPPYERFGGWPVFSKISALLTTFISLYWIKINANSIARSLSFGLFLIIIYLFCFVWASPWYIPSAGIIAILTSGMIIIDISKLISRSENLSKTSFRYLPFAFGAFILIFSISTYFFGAIQINYQQKIIEFGNRKQIGLWLKDNKEDGDTVFMECLGYIGFYSEMKTFDWPGMSSPEMVRARKELKTNDFAILIKHLKPTWLVLRNGEVDLINKSDPELLKQEYILTKEFDRVSDVENAPVPFGKPYLFVDAYFQVYKRVL